jgi:predicted HTH domain antitoxin
MQTLTVELPDTVNLDVQEAKMLLAVKLHERGILSLGQAAEVAGYSKRTFMELLGQYGGTLFNYSADELAQDTANAQRYSL